MVFAALCCIWVTWHSWYKLTGWPISRHLALFLAFHLLVLPRLSPPPVHCLCCHQLSTLITLTKEANTIWKRSLPRMQEHSSIHMASRVHNLFIIYRTSPSTYATINSSQYDRKFFLRIIKLNIYCLTFCMHSIVPKTLSYGSLLWFSGKMLMLAPDSIKHRLESHRRLPLIHLKLTFVFYAAIKPNNFCTYSVVNPKQQT